jgi:hypothetical protein
MYMAVGQYYCHHSWLLRTAPNRVLYLAANGLDECVTADTTVIALNASWRSTELANVAQIDLPICATASVPAEAARLYKRSIIHRTLLR